jgi:hypothetical protein
MRIRVKIGRDTIGDKWNGMIMNTMGGDNSLGSGKNNLVLDMIDWRLGCTEGVSTI